MFVVLRSWVVCLLSAFIVSPRETSPLTTLLQNAIRLEDGIVPTFGAAMNIRYLLRLLQELDLKQPCKHVASFNQTYVGVLAVNDFVSLPQGKKNSSWNNLSGRVSLASFSCVRRVKWIKLAFSFGLPVGNIGVDSVFTCVCSVIDHRWRQSVEAECVTDVLASLWRLVWSVTEQTQGNMESFCFKQ